MTNLVAVTGTKGAGKDTFVQPMIDKGYVLIKFAEPLKEMIRTYLRMYGLDNDEIERMVEGDLKEVPHEAWQGRTTRYAMQTLGTEWGRMMIGPKIWTDIFKRRASKHERVVNTDLRFTNEETAVYEVDDQAIIFRVVRGAQDKPMDGQHPSEVELWGIKTHFTIHNDGTKEELQAQVQDYVV